MRLLQLLDTQALKEVIEDHLKKVENIGIEIKHLYFDENRFNYKEGTFVYANEQGYHYKECERGNENVHKITDDVFEISFWSIYSLLASASIDYITKNDIDRLKTREVAFQKRLEWLGLIGKNFRLRGEIEISEILKVNPY